MAVTDGRVSFVALSETQSASTFTERIGVLPTHAAEVGDAVGNGYSGRRHDAAVWSLDRDFEAGGGEPLNDALSTLLLAFDGREPVVRELAQSFDLKVVCYGSSSSEQGGFWLSTGVLKRLAALGAEFYCTVYLDGSGSE